MRIENTPLPGSLIESTKTIEKKELSPDSVKTSAPQNEDAQPLLASPMGFGGTYSVASLRAAVDYYAKFLTVAENNMQAAQHATAIPQALLDRLNGR